MGCSDAQDGATASLGVREGKTCVCSMSASGRRQHRNAAGIYSLSSGVLPTTPGGAVYEGTIRPSVSVSLTFTHPICDHDMPKQCVEQHTPDTGGTFHQSILQPPLQGCKGTPSDARTDTGNGRLRPRCRSPPHLLTWGRGASHATCSRGHAQILCVRASCGPRGPRRAVDQACQAGCCTVWRREWRAQVPSSPANHRGQVISRPGLCCFFVASLWWNVARAGK